MYRQLTDTIADNLVFEINNKKNYFWVKRVSDSPVCFEMFKQTLGFNLHSLLDKEGKNSSKRNRCVHETLRKRKTEKNLRPYIAN
jgi:hypothetical protein